MLHSRTFLKIVDGRGGYIVGNPTGVRSVRALRIGTDAPQTDFIDAGDIVRRRLDAVHDLRIDAPVPVSGGVYDFRIIRPYAKAHFSCPRDEELTIAIDVSHPIVDELDRLKITGSRCRYSHGKHGR